MSSRNIDEALDLVCREDPRYAKNAYLFLYKALDFTVKLCKRQNNQGVERHVSGQELLEGIRQYALDQFGPLARTVLENWGVYACEDFGAMVFNLVKFELLKRTDRDRLEDFSGGYDFYVAFELPFKSSKPAPRPALSYF